MDTMQCFQQFIIKDIGMYGYPDHWFVVRVPAHTEVFEFSSWDDKEAEPSVRTVTLKYEYVGRSNRKKDHGVYELVEVLA